MKKILILLFVSLLVLSSCLDDDGGTIILRDYSEEELPEQVRGTWKAVMRCQESSELLNLSFTTQMTEDGFVAIGTGRFNPEENTITIRFEGIYNKELNILWGDLKWDFGSGTSTRTDRLSIDLDFYEEGSYIDLIKTHEPSGSIFNQTCYTQIKFVK